MSSHRIGRSDGQRPPATAATSSLTPAQKIVAEAHRRHLSVRLTDKSGATVTLSAASLLEIGRNPSLLATRYGIDADDFLSVIRETTVSGGENTTVDLTRTRETARLYDSIDDNIGLAARALIQPGRTAVSVASQGAFSIEGGAVLAAQPSFWQRVLDTLVEIFTVSLARTSTFDGAIDEDVWRNNAATIALAGGSELRAAMQHMPRSQAEERLFAIVRQANGSLRDVKARVIAQTLYLGLEEIYSPSPGMSVAQLDARLDSLRHALAPLGANAFGGSPGAWLRDRWQPKAEARLLAGDVSSASSANELRAVLTLATAGYSQLDPASQVRIAAQLLLVRHSAEARTGILSLIDNAAFLDVPADLRRVLLAGLERQGASHAAVVSRAATALSVLSGEPRRSAIHLLSSLPANVGLYEQTVALLSSEGFVHLPAKLQAKLLSELTARTTGRAVLDAAVLTDVGALIARRDFLGFPEAAQRAYVTALLGANSAEGRHSQLGLIGASAFRRLPEGAQRRLLGRFGAAGGELGSHIPTTVALLDALFGGQPPLRAEVINDVVTAIAASPQDELNNRLSALTRQFAQAALWRLTPSEQRHLLSSLENANFSSARTQALVGLLDDASFMQLGATSRTALLRHLAEAGPSADGQNTHSASGNFESILGLAKDDDFARLSATHQRQVLTLAERRAASYIRQVRYLIGTHEFHNATARLKSEALKLVVGGSHGAEVQRLVTLFHHPGFAHLTDDGQAALLVPAFASAEILSRITQCLRWVEQVSPKAQSQLARSIAAVSTLGDDAVVALQGLVVRGAFGALSAETQAQLLDAVVAHQGSSDYIQGLAALTAGAGFTALSVDERRRLVHDAVAQDWPLPLLLSFAAASAERQRTAIVAIDRQRSPNAGRNIAGLVASSEFAALNPAHQHLALEALLRGPDNDAYARDLISLVGNPQFLHLGDAIKSLAFAELRLHPTGASPRATLIALMTTPGFAQLGDGDKLRLLRLTGGTNGELSIGARNRMANLLESAELRRADVAGQRDRLLRFLHEEPPGHGAVGAPAGTFRGREAPFTVVGPTEVSSHGFHSGDAAALRYEVVFPGSPERRIAVFLPKDPVPASIGKVHSIADVAAGLAVLPGIVRARVVSVDVCPNLNPQDPHWRRVYHNPHHRSYMTADESGVIHIYPTRDLSARENMQASMIHETGHILSRQLWGTDTSGSRWRAWNDAITSDGIRPSGYARSSPGEDFSESLKVYQIVHGTPREAELRDLMPARFAILDRLMRGNTV